MVNSNSNIKDYGLQPSNHLWKLKWGLSFFIREKKKNLHAVRFELTRVATSELESDPLDHSGTHAIRTLK